MTNTVEIDQENLYKLISAQIVLDVYKHSFKKLKNNDELDQTINEQQHTPTGISLQKASKNSECSKFDPDLYVKIRKHLNIKRWNCISRPQYKYSCGISSLVSCWNYLYSTLGYGTLKPLTQEDALKILGFTEPFDSIRFGPFTGNITLMKWFYELNAHFSLHGNASFFYKPVGANKTCGITSKLAKDRLQTLLRSKDSAFIYHCYNHYCCPIGFEREPSSPTNIYFKTTETGADEEFMDWFIIGDPSRKYQQFHCVKWEDIDKDLSTKSPDYLNIRNLDRGIQQNSYNKKAERNLHCLIHFKKHESDPFFYSSLKFDEESLAKQEIN